MKPRNLASEHNLFAGLTSMVPAKYRKAKYEMAARHLLNGRPLEKARSLKLNELSLTLLEIVLPIFLCLPEIVQSMAALYVIIIYIFKLCW